MNITYIDSQSLSVQGKANEIYRRYGKSWRIKELGKGNGNWLLTKKSDVLVNGKSYRAYILSHYNKSRLTRSLAEKFSKDIIDGKITL